MKSLPFLFRLQKQSRRSIDIWLCRQKRRWLPTLLHHWKFAELQSSKSLKMSGLKFVAGANYLR
jgi:hypothetical protein